MILNLVHLFSPYYQPGCCASFLQLRHLLQLLLKLHFKYRNSGDSYHNLKVKRIKISLDCGRNTTAHIFLQHNSLSHFWFFLLLANLSTSRMIATSIRLATIKVMMWTQNSEQKQRHRHMYYSELHKSLMLPGFVLKKHKSIDDASGCALGQVQILWLTAPRERSKRKVSWRE